MTDINVTVSDQIIQVLDALCEKFGMAIEWGQSNIIPYVQKLLEKWVMYNIISQIVNLFIFAVSLFLGYMGTKWLFKKYREAVSAHDYDAEAIFQIFSIIATVILVVAGVFFGVFFSLAVKSITQCVVFPELWVIQSIQALLA